MEIEPNRSPARNSGFNGRPKNLAVKTETLERLDLGLPHRLRSSIHKPNELKENDLARMYLLMREYYADITETQFLRDLNEKTDVIVLRDLTDEIRGFSTLLVTDLEGSYGKARTVFSGDTVVAKEFWGQKELGLAFLKYLFLVKLKSPLRPVFWMLMSKGYKTYLLMANNFSTHYPRFERTTPPDIQSLVDDFYGKKFGAAYSGQLGLVLPHGATCKLREGVAAVTDDLIARLPRVAFFARKNPRWNEGVELACVAEMTLLMPVYYFLKKTVFKQFLRREKV